MYTTCYTCLSIFPPAGLCTCSEGEVHIPELSQSLADQPTVNMEKGWEAWKSVKVHHWEQVTRTRLVTVSG